jgi:hypothetical protein
VNGRSSDATGLIFYLPFTIYYLHSIMSAKLSVIFYIILCLEIGLVLTLLPWIPHGTLGLSDWGSNYFLLYAARKANMQVLQTVVASGWVRGAVSGVGLLNIGIAFWEIFHFKQTVHSLEQSSEFQGKPKEHVAASTATKDKNVAATPAVSHHQRRADRSDNAGN